MIKILFLFMLFFNMVGCAEKQEQHRAVEYPDQVIEGFEVNHTVGGETSWNLSARRAHIFEEKNIALADDPIIKFYEEGQLSSTLEAKHARLNTKTSDIEAWDDVVVISSKEGSRLETSRLFYKSKQKKMVTEEPVKLFRKDSVTTGVGMESNVDMSSIIIKKQKVEIFKQGTEAQRHKGTK